MAHHSGVGTAAALAVVAAAAFGLVAMALGTVALCRTSAVVELMARPHSSVARVFAHAA